MEQHNRFIGTLNAETTSALPIDSRSFTSNNLENTITAQKWTSPHYWLFSVQEGLTPLIISALMDLGKKLLVTSLATQFADLPTMYLAAFGKCHVPLLLEWAVPYSQPETLKRTQQKQRMHLLTAEVCKLDRQLCLASLKTRRRRAEGGKTLGQEV